MKNNKKRAVKNHDFLTTKMEMGIPKPPRY